MKNERIKYVLVSHIRNKLDESIGETLPLSTQGNVWTHIRTKTDAPVNYVRGHVWEQVWTTICAELDNANNS